MQFGNTNAIIRATTQAVIIANVLVAGFYKGFFITEHRKIIASSNILKVGDLGDAP